MLVLLEYILGVTWASPSLRFCPFFISSHHSSFPTLENFLHTKLYRILHPLDTFNPLCSEKPVSLTTSLNSWGKVICCLCAGFHVALTPVEASCHCQPTTPSESTPFFYWLIKPWFYY